MFSIALDGPAGAGKSSLAKAAAKELGFIYVDTGALYRAIGLKFIEEGYDETLNCNVDDVLSRVDIAIEFIDGAQHVILNGRDVSEEIRTPSASMMTSSVSAQPAVRAFLLEMQRRLAETDNVLMDGRDIGTVVLPNASLKVFVTASVAERAERRFKELAAKGDKSTYEEVYRDIEQRDYQDSHREIAPLKPADNAVIFDTSGNTLEQSLEALLKIIRERLDLS